MELRHLRYFVAVAEELNFRKAAERLHISQPPLSMQIAQLETELGAKLFERSSQRVSLTMAGRLFFERTQNILAQVKDAAREVRMVTDGEAGEIRVGFTQSTEFAHALPAVINRFRTKYPRVTFQLEQMKSSEQLSAIAGGTLDLGIFRKPEAYSPETVELSEFLDDPSVLAVPSSSALARQDTVKMRELKDEAFISTPVAASSGLRKVLDNLARAGKFKPRIVQEAREVPTMLGLVASGMGIAVVPALAQKIGVGGITFLTILDKAAQSSLCIGVRRDPSSKLIMELRAMLLGAEL